MYLHEIVAPTPPQAARYPKRWLNIGLTLAATLTAFAAVVGAIGFVRNNMA
ncbi:MAG TPA: hypothetical protein VED87_12070 [Methylocystis sp.]|nr:hypothetical protein [Methylocystis sp.]